MARKKVEVNKTRGENLRKVLTHYGMNQNEFAERIHYSKEHISYIINGRRNLTLDIAEKVVDVFPDVRLEWLIGHGGYMNWEEEVEAQAEELSECFAGDIRIKNALKELIECLGYKVYMRLEGVKQEDDVTYFDDNVEACNIVAPNGQEEEITYQEFQKIIYNITSFTENELSKQFDINWQLLREEHTDG